MKDVVVLAVFICFFLSCCEMIVSARKQKKENGFVHGKLHKAVLILQSRIFYSEGAKSKKENRTGNRSEDFPGIVSVPVLLERREEFRKETAA